jgi:signal transduction histidine kinase
MEGSLENPAEQIKRLQRCINDLVSVLALAATWADAEPSQVVGAVTDALLRMLDLDLVFVRLTNPTGDAPIKIIRIGPSQKSTTDARIVSEAIDGWFGDNPQKWPPLVQIPIGGRGVSIAPLQLWLQGEKTLIAVGSRRPDFPSQTERLLFSVAANQVAIGLQKARLLTEQKRIADELDERVAERTGELAAANEELRNEIAERKRAEEELRDTQSKLAHMTRLMTIGQLTASIAHEVNQPLAGIITNANTCLRMLAAQPPNIEGAKETARRTIRDGNRASEVIKRLRALFSKKDPSLEPVDLNEATREVIALSLSKLQGNRVILRTELADGLPNVSGDRVQLQQVILNLIQNGSDAMSSIDDRPRDMLVKTERDGHEALCLTVRDVGVGFSQEDGGRLFDAFYTTKGDGMGIGLSVSRSIVERHGGRMWTAGNEGPGVSFSFSVPLLPEQKTDAETTVRTEAPRSEERQSK